MATAVNNPALSPKWWTGAAWETPAVAARARRLSAAGAVLGDRLDGGIEQARRKSPW